MWGILFSPCLFFCKQIRFCIIIFYTFSSIWIKFILHLVYHAEQVLYINRGCGFGSIRGMPLPYVIFTIKYEPAHYKMYNKTCATSLRIHSQIRVFADHMCLLQPRDYPKRDKWESFPYWVDVKADLRFCVPYGSYCRFCQWLAYMYFN